MRITIGGCRDFNDYEVFNEFVTEYIESINNDDEIVILSGHCSGTDIMAERYAKKRAIALKYILPNGINTAKEQGRKEISKWLKKVIVLLHFGIINQEVQKISSKRQRS